MLTLSPASQPGLGCGYPEPVMRALFLLLAASAVFAGDWPQYRGPGGMGIVETPLPVELGPDKNVAWKTAVPNGGSSPVLTEDRIFLTAYEDEKLYVLCLDRADGRILWRREVPRPRKEVFNKTHGPASPTPVTDGENVYAFFGDFGLISFGRDGQERWRLPLGPFANINGHGSSPILADGMLILVVDQNDNSYLMAVDPGIGHSHLEDRPLRDHPQLRHGRRLSPVRRSVAARRARRLPPHLLRAADRQEALVGRPDVVAGQVRPAV